jgi:anti-anti-sigma factor
MLINKTEEGNIMIFSMTGRLDTMHFPVVDQELSTMIGSGRKEVVIDCTNMDYISSSGLRVLLKALKQMEASKGRLTLSGLQPQIAQVFKISGFDHLFEIYPGVGEALASFS